MFNLFKTQYKIVSDELVTEGKYGKYSVWKRGFETFFQWEVLGIRFVSIDEAIELVNRLKQVRYKTVWRG